MRKKPTTLSPVERALVAKKWNESTWDANIHALISADVGNLVGKGGCVFFVAIALARQNCQNSPDHRIIRATMNAVYEVSETDEIDDLTYRVTGLARLAGASPVDPPVMQRLVKALHCWMA
jgi:hypothetical protein